MPRQISVQFPKLARVLSSAAPHFGAQGRQLAPKWGSIISRSSDGAFPDRRDRPPTHGQPAAGAARDPTRSRELIFARCCVRASGSSISSLATSSIRRPACWTTRPRAGRPIFWPGSSVRGARRRAARSAPVSRASAAGSFSSSQSSRPSPADAEFSYRSPAGNNTAPGPLRTESDSVGYDLRPIPA